MDWRNELAGLWYIQWMDQQWYIRWMRWKINKVSLVFAHGELIGQCSTHYLLVNIPLFTLVYDKFKPQVKIFGSINIPNMIFVKRSPWCAD